jgi:hypothetical protein
MFLMAALAANYKISSCPETVLSIIWFYTSLLPEINFYKGKYFVSNL